MLDRGWVWSRGLAAAAVLLASASPVSGCTGNGKPASDTFSAGDASMTMNHHDAAGPPDTAAPTPPADATDAPADATDSPSDSTKEATADGPSDGPACEGGLTFCGGGCVDTKKDPSNCGQCTNTCGSTFVCAGGQCLCPLGGGQAVCNNTCVNISTDPSNCGACGHSCQGSVCASSLCQPTVVATVTGAPIWDIAVDSANVYWTQIAVNSSSGIVSYKPFAGSMTTLSITSTGDPTIDDPRGIAVDNHNMYWVDVANGAVEALSLNTAKYVLLRPSQRDGGVLDSPTDITSDGTNVYWVTFDGQQIISAPIGGGGPLTIVAPRENHPHAITFDQNNVYWVDYGDAAAATPTGSVKQAPKVGCTADAATCPVLLAQNEDKPWDVAVDDTSVYWTDHANPGSVKKVPIGGGTVVTLASGQGAPYGIAVDADYVYWTNFDDKNVMRLSKGADGGAPFALATAQNTPSALVVDSKNVYWADPGAQAILKVAK
ncbi:MAG: hypothetical protein M3O46_06895 [Myxococcota bacterium]|nr:hypothetical protein [Myxococcota bacterium]